MLAAARMPMKSNAPRGLSRGIPGLSLFTSSRECLGVIYGLFDHHPPWMAVLFVKINRLAGFVAPFLFLDGIFTAT